MKKTLLQSMLTVLCIFSTVTLSAQIRVLESFNTENSNWKVSSGASSVLSGNGFLDVSMALQSNSKYRADLSFENSAEGSGYVLNSATDVYIAIKFKNERPNGALKFEMRRTDKSEGSGTRTDGYYNSYNNGNPASVASSDGGYIYYYNLTSDNSYLSQVAESKEMQILKFIIADAALEPYSYSVDWVATFPSEEAIISNKDYDDIPTSINDIKSESVKIWAEKGNINFSGIANSSQINVFSITGSLLYSTKAEAEVGSIPFSAQGSFLVQVITNGKSTFAKLVK